MKGGRSRSLSCDWVKTQELVVARMRRHVEGWKAGQVVYVILE